MVDKFSIFDVEGRGKVRKVDSIINSKYFYQNMDANIFQSIMIISVVIFEITLSLILRNKCNF